MCLLCQPYIPFTISGLMVNIFMMIYVGVMGMDFTIQYLYSFVKSSFTECEDKNFAGLVQLQK